MNKKDNFKFPFEQFRTQLEQIEKLYTSPIVDVIAQQQNFYNSLVADTFTGFRESIGSLNIQPIFHDDAITAAFRKTIEPMQRMVNNYSKSIGTQFKDIINTSTAVLIEESFSPLIESLTTRNYENINEQCMLGLKPLFDVLDNIEVVNDHVEISDTPISRHFFNDDDLSLSISGKLNWDFNKVMSFLCFVIAVLGWLFPDPLSHFSNNATSNNPEIVLTNEQANTVIEYLSIISKNTEIIIQNMNQAPTTSIPDSQLSEPQSDIATPSSAKVPDHEEPCTYGNSPELSITE